MAYDPECQKLVEYFLQDEPLLKADLSFIETVAQELQNCIEDSILLYKQDILKEKEKPDPPSYNP